MPASHSAKKSVDIVVVRDSGRVVTVDVKGLAGTTSLPVDNIKKIAKDHLLIFVSYSGKIDDHTISAEAHVVLSQKLEPLVYHSPNGKRRILQLARMRRDGKHFKDAWRLLE